MQSETPYVHRPIDNTIQDWAKPTQTPVKPMNEVKTPAVISDSTIRDSVIPNTKAKYNSLVPQQNPQVVQGEVVQNAQPQGRSSYAGDYASALAELGIDMNEDAISPEQQMLFDMQQKENDKVAQAGLANISRRYNERNELLKKQQRGQEKSLTSALMGSGGQFSPLSMAGNVASLTSAGIRQFNDLQAEEASLIAEAQQAKTASDYKLLGEKLNLIEKKKEEKLKIAEKVANEMAAENTRIREKQEKEISEINNVIKDAGKGGAPKDVLAAIQGAGSLAEAVAAAGDYLNTTSGIVGEYNLYRRQAIENGLTPKTFEEYQDADANRKKIQLGNTGLPASTMAQVDKLSTAFDNAPIVKSYNEALRARKEFDNIVDGGASGPSDVATVYTFMKALDPASVVRETEFDTAAKSGNIFKGYLAKFNGYFKDTGGLLPENVKAEFKKIIAQKYKATEDLYENLREETARKINMRTGTEDGDAYLTDYNIDLKEKLINEQKGVTEKINDYYQKAETQEARNFIDALEAENATDEEIYNALKARGIDLGPISSATGGDPKVENLKARIAKTETGGRENPYQTRSDKPTVRAGGRKDWAYGKYQIMGDNIPSWTKEALGKSMTIEEFMNDPEAQEKVASFKFDQYLKKYGSEEDAASVWFTGQPLAIGKNKKDAFGTTGEQYVNKVMRG